jgi:uncharacterized membrane protein
MTNKKEEQKRISRIFSVNINTFLYIGAALLLLTIALSKAFPSIPTFVTTILYILAICSFIFYMLEIQYRRRTGDVHDEKARKKAMEYEPKSSSSKNNNDAGKGTKTAKSKTKRK